jgi:hypothetical protein
MGAEVKRSIAVSDICVRNHSAADILVRITLHWDKDVPNRKHPDKDVRMSGFF